MADARGTWRTPHGHEVELVYRLDTADWNIIGSCLNDDEYRIPEGLTGWAFDIGAHLGAVSIALALDNPGLRVLSVEPVPDNLRLLRLNLGARAIIVPGAVGSGDVTIQHGYRGSETASHNAFVGNWRDDSSIEHDEITYRAKSLRDLMLLVGTTRVAWLKVDTEGAEWTFLDTPDVAAVDIIVGEWHRRGDHVQSDMLRLLGDTHLVTFSGSAVGPGGFRAERR